MIYSKNLKSTGVNNPSVFRLFKSYAETVKGSGRKKYSAWAIINRIRWHHEIEKGGDEFKISNDFIALYARVLMRSDARFKDFFAIKEMKRVSEDVAGLENPGYTRTEQAVLFTEPKQRMY